MKILQVIPYFCFGGAETMCENLTYALTRMGHDVTVVSLFNEQTPIARRMEENGIRIHYLDKKLGLDLSMISKLILVFLMLFGRAGSMTMLLAFSAERGPIPSKKPLEKIQIG